MVRNQEDEDLYNDTSIDPNGKTNGKAVDLAKAFNIKRKT